LGRDRDGGPRPTIRPFDPAAYLESPEAVLAYLDGAFADGDAGEIADALGVVARARGMSRISEQTGLTRQSLYKALSSDGNPEFATVLKVIRALGFRLHLEPASAADMSQSRRG
jgi:probable addiction module antidote protein